MLLASKISITGFNLYIGRKMWTYSLPSTVSLVSFGLFYFIMLYYLFKHCGFVTPSSKVDAHSCVRIYLGPVLCSLGWKNCQAVFGFSVIWAFVWLLLLLFALRILSSNARLVIVILPVVFFLRIVLGIHGHLCLSMDFRTVFSSQPFLEF